MSFSQFGLNDKLASTLDLAGFENPTPLQSQLIPLILQRKNVIVESQTAAGKTGSYLIPLTSYLLSNPIEEHQGSRVLVLTSRRERVNQINYTLKRIVKNFNLRIGFISGGRPYQHQMRLLKRPLDILIATPGRLDDLVNNNKTDFSKLEALIIDDFSIIFNHGLQELCRKILNQTEGQCATLAFVQREDKSGEFIKELLPQATIVEVEEEKHPLLSVPQSAYIADDHTHKIAIMDQMLDELSEGGTLIYTSNNRAAVSLQESLSNHAHTAELAHQIENEGKITAEKHPCIIISDQIDVKVATGTYKNIFHFDLPKQPAVFQNRIANKGWTELENPAAILVGPHDRITLKKIEAQAGESIPQKTIPGLEPLNAYNPTPLLSLSGDGKKKKRKTAGKNNKQGQQVKRKPKVHLSNGAKNSNRQKQHKGPYGRLNGGIHRKRGSQHNGDNHYLAKGVGAANFEHEIQELGERKPKQRKVIIRYKDRKSRSASSAESSDSPGNE